jgi:SPP1 gp7 family putative phage head morphogenesis protein
MNSNTNLLKLKKWKLMGFEEYEWLTVGDEKVRPEHRKKNHRVYKIEDALRGKTIFPGGSLDPTKKNINCRCTAILYS